MLLMIQTKKKVNSKGYLDQSAWVRITKTVFTNVFFMFHITSVKILAFYYRKPYKESKGYIIFLKVAYHIHGYSERVKERYDKLGSYLTNYFLMTNSDHLHNFFYFFYHIIFPDFFG